MAKIYMATKDDVTTLGGNIGPIVQSELDAIYAAVAAKGGTVPTEKTLGNLAAAVESVPPPMLGAWLGELTDFSALNSDATSVRSYAFYNSRNLVSATLPNVNSIGAYAFYGTTSLSAFSAPNLASAGAYAFASSGLPVISLPSLLAVPTQAFLSSANLKAVLLDSATTITGGTSANNATFGSCTSLEYIKVPSLTAVSGSTFFRYVSRQFVVDHRPSTSETVLSLFASKTWMSTDEAKQHGSFYCSDGYLTWDGSAWVLNTYTGNEPYYNGWED